ncbi:hypothetical protein BB560_001869 [Smittium megazygosporum]|uniref:Uncharacterized protein n=1 Tax=Smittium megazygosporum TaxID=133381 RepID=A0A2T9ZGC6_9FUNG|nr:hypothetical protein BB560_001869 [Smittium megazygosporum]
MNNLVLPSSADKDLLYSEFLSYSLLVSLSKYFDQILIHSSSFCFQSLICQDIFISSDKPSKEEQSNSKMLYIHDQLSILSTNTESADTEILFLCRKVLLLDSTLNDPNYTLHNVNELINYIWSNSDPKKESTILPALYLFFLESQTYLALLKYRRYFYSLSISRNEADPVISKKASYSVYHSDSSDFSDSPFEIKPHSKKISTRPITSLKKSFKNDVTSMFDLSPFKRSFSFGIFNPSLDSNSLYSTFINSSKERYEKILEKFNNGKSKLEKLVDWADSEFPIDSFLHSLNSIVDVLIQIIEKPKLLSYVELKNTSPDIMLEVLDFETLFQKDNASAPGQNQPDISPQPSEMPPPKSTLKRNLNFMSKKDLFDNQETSTSIATPTKSKSLKTSNPHDDKYSTPPSQTGSSASENVLQSTRYVVSSKFGDTEGGGRFHRSRSNRRSHESELNISPTILSLNRHLNPKKNDSSSDTSKYKVRNLLSDLKNSDISLSSNNTNTDSNSNFNDNKQEIQ